MKESELSEKTTRPHQGRNVKRFRDMWSMKQDALAATLGGDWTQKKVSQIEAMDEIDPALLQDLAKALQVTPEAIQHFDGERMLAIISNTFNNHDQSSQFANNIHYPETNNESLLIEIKKLHEALIKEKDERIALLEKIIEKSA